MKFLVDAHLPRRLAYQLRAFGHEAVHTLDLPRGKRTPDPVRWGLPGEYQVP
jgi:predicted nuclease of predicted toxin-antitoxin system